MPSCSRHKWGQAGAMRVTLEIIQVYTPQNSTGIYGWSTHSYIALPVFKLEISDNYSRSIGRIRFTDCVFVPETALVRLEKLS